MENNLLKKPDLNEAIKKIIMEKIEAIKKLKQVNAVIKKKNNKEGLRVHEEELYAHYLATAVNKKEVEKSTRAGCGGVVYALTAWD